MFAKTLRNPSVLFKTALGLSGMTMINQYYERQKQCCGIVGILSTKPNAHEYILEGIELLQNRGYDSAGVASFDKDKNFLLTKYASDTLKKIDCIQRLKDEVPKKHYNAITAIGHTRWATCGGKTDENAHPHTDQNDRVFLIHNGTIDDVPHLRKELISKGVKLRSQTDTELIAQFIGLELQEGLNLFEATKKVLNEKIRGTWGLLIVDKEDPEKMVVARNGSPILVGLHEDSIYIASERIAFEKYTSNFITLNDGEMILLDLENRQQLYKSVKERISFITEKMNVEVKPRQPYRYFFEQEIEEQPESLLKVMGNGSRLSVLKEDCTKLGGLERHVESISKLESMNFIACGTSYYAALFALKFFQRLECFETKVQAIEASEFCELDISSKNAGAIFISQSGETRDIYHALDVCKKKGLFTMGVINVVGSLIASNVDCGVYLNIGREVAVPATKSFTAQVTALIMMAIWISHQKKKAHLYSKRKELKNLLRQIPVCFGEVIREVDAPCKEVARALQNSKNMMILGKGPSAAIAKEGALKIKEVTYIHAEAFVAGEMKHGPIALINCDEPGSTKVLLMIFDDEYFNDMHLALSEVKSRQAHTIVITDCPDKIDQSKVDSLITIPNLKDLTPLLAIVVFQKISLEVCFLNDLNPDKPRNLAKTVTVG